MSNEEDREPWTPTTEQVRAHYVFNQSDQWDPERGKAFDRWLASVRTPAPALPQEAYAPEVFERMKALLQEAHGSPMRALRLAVSTPQDTEWEYDAGYQADNGIEMRWFSMGSGAFTIREAAEHEVERFADPQIRLVRRTRPGPWEPVPTEGVSE